MLLSETVETTINYKNIQKYLDLGYKFDYFINNKGKPSTKRGVKILVEMNDLDNGSSAIIKYKCDYCGEKVEVRFCDYMRHKDAIGEKDACKECGNIKLGDKCFEKYGTRSPFGRKEIQEKSNNTVKERYGVDSISQLDEVKNKIKETNIKKYGASSYTQTDEYKEKSKKTCLEKYGVDNPSKSPEIINKIKRVQFEKYGSYYSSTDEYKDKYKQTCMDRYGVENVFQSEEMKEKSRQTMIERYGVDCLMKIPEIAKERAKKCMITKSNMGVLPSSRQQEYLHKIYGGNKNYVVGNCALDIALLNNMIDIEFDGSGHDLRVKFGDCTQEEFYRKEMSRKYYLNKLGWKDFRIISLKDKLPSDEMLLTMLYIGIKWFDKNHSWIKFNIDNGTYETSNGIFDFNFGRLRNITEEDLKQIK